MKSKITRYLSLFVIISIISLATIVFLFIIFNKTSITATQSYLMIGSVIVSLIVLFSFLVTLNPI